MPGVCFHASAGGADDRRSRITQQTAEKSISFGPVMAKRKQKLSFYLEFPAWLSLRDHAIRSKKTVTDVLLEWIRPRLHELPPPPRDEQPKDD